MADPESPSVENLRIPLQSGSSGSISIALVMDKPITDRLKSIFLTIPTVRDVWRPTLNTVSPFFAVATSAIVLTPFTLSPRIVFPKDTPQLQWQQLEILILSWAAAAS